MESINVQTTLSVHHSMLRREYKPFDQSYPVFLGYLAMQAFLTQLELSNESLKDVSVLANDYYNLFVKSQNHISKDVEEELSKLYKSQAQTSTRLLELLDKVKFLEDELSRCAKE